MENVNSIIKVCVYSDRALVTREMIIRDIDGENTAVFTDLTPNLLKDSLRVSGQGNFIILDNNINEIILEDTNISELNSIVQKIDALLAEQKSLDLDMEKYNTVLSMLGSIQFAEDVTFVESLDYVKAGAEDFQKALGVYSGEQQSARKEILNLKKKKRDLAVKQAVLQKNIEMLQIASSRTAVNCVVNFMMDSPGDAVLQVSYVVNNASWSPLYDGRLLYEEKEFELISYGVIEQMTGEEWNDVTLELSTSNPVIGAFLPEPEAWYINIFIPPPPPPQEFMKDRKRAARKKDKLEEPRDYEMDNFEEEILSAGDVPEPEMEAGLMQASIAPKIEEAPVTEDTFSSSEIKSAGMSVTYTCGSKQDIPTDGSEKKVFISMERFPVRYDYIIMPAVEEAAYLKISMQNSRDYPILQGPVKVFRDFDYVGDSRMDSIAPGEEMSLYMGIDDSIKVKRELINKLSGKKGFTGNDTAVEYSYRLTIESFKDEEETVKIFEQLPVSNNKEIEVKITNKGGFKDPDIKGILEQEMVMKPKERKIITWSYSVRHPSDKTVHGLK